VLGCDVREKLAPFRRNGNTISVVLSSDRVGKRTGIIYILLEIYVYTRIENGTRLRVGCIISLCKVVTGRGLADNGSRGRI